MDANRANRINPAIQPLPFDAAGLRGLSERLMRSHHQNNYGGVVNRLHAIRAQLAALDWTAAPGFRRASLPAGSMNEKRPAGRCGRNEV